MTKSHKKLITEILKDFKDGVSLEKCLQGIQNIISEECERKENPANYEVNEDIE